MTVLRSLFARFAVALAVSLAGAPAVMALDLRPLRFGTNWLAQAEHGGYYQAVVDGTYARFGLDVTIVPGGPQTNNLLLLPAGRIDFYMGGNMIQAFSAVQQGVPVVTVAAIFQKEPQVLMSHPGVGLDRFEDLARSPTVLVGQEGVATFYQWLKADHGFRDEQVKPYAYNTAPFIADKTAVQQGYVTAEPLAVEKEGGFRPNVFLLADHGFDTYSTTILARREMVEKEPAIVQKFVDASIIGWMNYLYGDNAAANAAIMKDNPDISAEQIAYSVAKMKEYGIIDSGDARTLGVGAMTDARMASFFGKMVRSGLFLADLDYRKSYTLSFIGRKVGMDLRR